jgi:hypothetical protein
MSDEELTQSEYIQRNWLSPVEAAGMRFRITTLEEYCTSLERSIEKMIEVSNIAESCACDRTSNHDCVCIQCAIRYVSQGYVSHYNVRPIT